MVLNTEWYEPQEPSDPADVAAAERALAFCLGWFADPLYKGDYPAAMRERCGDRLPRFSPEERALVLGSNDFFAINCYSARYACEGTSAKNLKNALALLKILPYVGDVFVTKLKAGVAAAMEEKASGKAADGATAQPAGARHARLGGPTMPTGLPATSYLKDGDYLTVVPLDGELTAPGWPVAHYGLGRLLLHLQRVYTPRGGVAVTEAGAAFEDEWGKPPAAERQRAYLQAQAVVLRRAMLEGVELWGYFWWTLLDNFEWSYGYSKRFGLFAVDFDRGAAKEPTLARTPRLAAGAFRALAARNAVAAATPEEDYAACLRRPDGL